MHILLFSCSDSITLDKCHEATKTVSIHLSFNTWANTRDNNYKLLNHILHYDLQKHPFLHALLASEII